jgi:hypothetical protein
MKFLSDWRRYVRMSPDELADIDIAVLNLVCALGLPGAEKIDVDECVRTINGWAEVVKRWTNAAYPVHFTPNPGEYFNSESFFKAVCLVNALQRQCGVKYHPAKKELTIDDPFDFDDYFIWSVIQGEGGNCATLPVIYAAVGRRLGYPIKLVPANRHMFARWDVPARGERFNIEGTNQRFDSFPDDHYRKWPYPFSPVDEKRFGYLQSLRPSEELGHFVGKRAALLEDLGRFCEAAETLAFAIDLDPDSARTSTSLLSCLKAWKLSVQKRLPPREYFPRHEVLARPGQRRWSAAIRWEVEREFAALQGLEDILNDQVADQRWWQPLREGKAPLVPLPTLIETHYPRENAGNTRRSSDV